MEIKRRGFIATAGTIGAAGMLLPTGLLAQDLLSAEDVLTQEDFRARQKDWFYLHSDDAAHQCDLRLDDVIERGSTAALQQFALLLRSRRGAEVMPDGMYNVAGEPFALYIRHSHTRRGKQYYLAEFALLMDSA